MLSRTGQFFWAVFILDHLIGLLAAYEQIPCSVTGGQDDPWLRIPPDCGQEGFLQCLSSVTLWGPPYPLGSLPGLYESTCALPVRAPAPSHTISIPPCPCWASILTFPLTCSHLKTKIKYLCWKLEMLGLKTNSSENFPLEQCPKTKEIKTEGWLDMFLSMSQVPWLRVLAQDGPSLMETWIAGTRRFLA